MQELILYYDQQTKENDLKRLYSSIPFLLESSCTVSSYLNDMCTEMIQFSTTKYEYLLTLQQCKDQRK
uniref:Uncharacterized protein n=1 Tax=Romanomermis culicivorax TaxID=13658 RepID=A0A915IP22_ROMCU